MASTNEIDKSAKTAKGTYTLILPLCHNLTPIGTWNFHKLGMAWPFTISISLVSLLSEYQIEDTISPSNAPWASFSLDYSISNPTSTTPFLVINRQHQFKNKIKVEQDNFREGLRAQDKFIDYCSCFI